MEVTARTGRGKKPRSHPDAKRGAAEELPSLYWLNGGTATRRLGPAEVNRRLETEGAFISQKILLEMRLQSQLEILQRNSFLRMT